MGGYGSGSRSTRKLTVEECLSLDAARLLNLGIIRGSYASGMLWWKNSAGETTNSVSYRLQGESNISKNLRLSYQRGGTVRGVPIEELIQTSDNSTLLRGHPLVVHLPAHS